MNIFYLDDDPKLSAEYQCDKHVVKMILESAQLLSSAHHLCKTTVDVDNIYRLTHKNHPCSIWVRQHRNHYTWLYKHFIALCNEYTFRYGKIHATERMANELLTCPLFETEIECEAPKCMPDFCKTSNVVDSYRKYYREVKLNTISVKYTKREKPKWLKPIVNF